MSGERWSVQLTIKLARKGKTVLDFKKTIIWLDYFN